MKTPFLLIVFTSFIAIAPAGRSDTNVFPATGNVGVGTTSPQAPLEIVGDVKVGGNATISGSLSAGNLSSLKATGAGYFQLKGDTSWSPAATQLDAGPGFLWWPAKTILRVGYFSGDSRNVSLFGESSIALGSPATAPGVWGVAIGSSSYAGGGGSVAIGYGAYTTTQAGNAVALGMGVARGVTSIAINGDTAYENNVAIGMVDAAGKSATAIGVYCGAYAAGETVLGVCNQGTKRDGQIPSATTLLPSDPVFEVGIGGDGSYAPDSAANAMTLYRDGGAAIGANATASGVRSLALGTSTVASKPDSVALGARSTATSDGALAILGTATGESSTAVGGFGIASGIFSVAIGGGTSTGNFSTLLGLGTAEADFSSAIGCVYALALGETVVGLNNLGLRRDHQSPNATRPSPLDPVFEVGNGGDGSYLPYSSSNAFTVYRDGGAAVPGDLTVGGNLTVAGSTSSVTLNPSGSGVVKALHGSGGDGLTFSLVTDSINVTMNQGATNGIYFFRDQQAATTGSAAYGIQFTDGTNAFDWVMGGVSQLHLSSNGNVGIGTTNPTAKLDIRGGVSIGGQGEKLILQRASDLEIVDSNPRYYDVNGRAATRMAMFMDNGVANLVADLNGEFDRGGYFSMVCKGGIWLNPEGGKVGVGTTTPDQMLTVKGAIHATEVIVDASIAANDIRVTPKAWADHVFDDTYRVAPLREVEQEIKAHKHLPGIPSAAEVAERGVSVGDMQARLLAKIEELTLHQIEQEKRIAALEQQNTELSHALERR